MFDRDARIDAPHALRGGGGFRLAEVFFRGVKLAVEVVFVKGVAVDKNEPAYAGAGENFCYPASEAAAAGDRRAGFKQLSLPLKPKGTDRALITRGTHPAAQRGYLRFAHGKAAQRGRFAADLQRDDGGASAAG
ncbi:hypothetical protein SDC9_195816 [bioreactor metagenome]|uniref:Uncharacterized protein n=1 Tax=bioreactor metagenome TaxID=1076179 RepID=A0A645IA46_9ZZZZ